MGVQDLFIRRLMSGGLITNYHCTSACRHCLYRSSPRWPKEFIAKPIKEGAYPIITRLFSEGIGAFLSFAEERFGFRPSRPFYARKCELCFEARRFLVLEKGVDLKELQPRGHYLYG